MNNCYFVKAYNNCYFVKAYNNCYFVKAYNNCYFVKAYNNCVMFVVDNPPPKIDTQGKNQRTDICINLHVPWIYTYK